MDDVHSNGLGIFPFFGQHTLCTEGWPGEYRIKDGRPFVRLYFMYITIGGNPSFRRSRAADIPLHNSLFIDGGMCRGLMTVTLSSCNTSCIVCSYFYMLVTH